MDYYLKQVKEFRDLVGLKQTEEQHAKLYQEESLELDTATTKALLADAYADCVVVMAGWCLDCPDKAVHFDDFINAVIGDAHDAGIDLRAAFDTVHTSNMSKVCESADIIPTASKYNLMGIETVCRRVSYNLYAFYSSKNHVGELSDFIEGKLLKPVCYVAPDWSKKGWEL